MLVNNFLLETQLGRIRGDGWFNYNYLSGELKYSDQDKLDLSLFFNNIDLVKFNRYLPWGLESRGLISGSIEIEGMAEFPEFSSTLNVQSPGFDKINARELSGKIYYKNKRLDFRNLSLITETGRYSGSGFLPIDLKSDYGHPRIGLCPARMDSILDWYRRPPYNNPAAHKEDDRTDGAARSGVVVIDGVKLSDLSNHR